MSFSFVRGSFVRDSLCGLLCGIEEPGSLARKELFVDATPVGCIGRTGLHQMVETEPTTLIL